MQKLGKNFLSRFTKRELLIKSILKSIGILLTIPCLQMSKLLMAKDGDLVLESAMVNLLVHLLLQVLYMERKASCDQSLQGVLRYIVHFT